TPCPRPDRSAPRLSAWEFPALMAAGGSAPGVQSTGGQRRGTTAGRRRSRAVSAPEDPFPLLHAEGVEPIAERTASRLGQVALLTSPLQPPADRLTERGGHRRRDVDAPGGSSHQDPECAIVGRQRVC